MQGAPRVFLSYSTTDKHLAGRVKNYFTTAGFSVFLAHEDMDPSDEWIHRIRTELRKCHVFVRLITSSFRLSLWTDQEAGFAISRSKSIKNKCLILSLVVTPVNIPPHGFLKDFQALPVEEQTLEVALKRAVNSLDNKLGLQSLRREIVIKAFCDSRSFDAAKKNADGVRELLPLSLPEAARIATASVENNQIYWPDELKPRVNLLLREHFPELDAQLKNKVKQLFP